MGQARASTIYRKDYQAPDFWIEQTNLVFELEQEYTTVTSTLHLRRNSQSSSLTSGLQLHGDNLDLLSISLDGRELDSGEYELNDTGLHLYQLPDQCELTSVTRIDPANNTTLEGLYRSRTMYCTQCEAEGFRRIAYYLDRPDVMSVFTVTIIADKKQCPVLLSNGNLEASGDGEQPGKHWARWHDPFPKPSYLFALVAGELAMTESQFVTASGREVCLRIYVEAKDLDKCDFAMQSLIDAMRWDEQKYGREYDLDIFNIVAVDDFNMGAMENKSLNIFNTACVLAKPETTTDKAFQQVQAVVAHEYFHNWSGNRVTCRDWFQLSLKEGFTVFRDAQFSADMGSPTVKRVEDVSLLRTMQFAEDAGPMAHPVRPDSYIEISNFYTVTIYEKGAEVVRMLHQLLGEEGFRRGSDLYFQRHDGQAVTCEDFVRAMEDANNCSLSLFRNWYSQAGTPELHVEGHYDSESRCYTLDVSQSCPPTPGQADKLPFHIPLKLSLFGDAGALALRLQGEATASEQADNTVRVLDITERQHRFIFTDIPEAPIPSLLRDFSAPVKLHFSYSRQQLAYLMQYDTDGFCRWDASQQFAIQVLQELITQFQQQQTPKLDSQFVEAYRTLLRDQQLDPAMVALMLTLPSVELLIEMTDQVDIEAIYQARDFLRREVAQQLYDEFLQCYSQLNQQQTYLPSPQQIAQRSLKNCVLSWLTDSAKPLVATMLQQQFTDSDNMTDQLAAFRCLLNSDFATARQQAVARFYQQWHQEPLVLNQWFMAQAVSDRDDALQLVKQLTKHAAFDIKNPNKVRALIGSFCRLNLRNFHAADGSGYIFLADQILILDGLNPQIAARLVSCFSSWRKFPPAQQQIIRQQLDRILQKETLSPDVYELASKTLGDF